MINGNAIGGTSGYGKTFILIDEHGNELTGVVVDKETVFTATDNDVREGLVYASDGGVSTGTKNIPAYRTTQESWLVLPGEYFSIPLSHYDKYNYTKFQCVVAEYNTSVSDSVSVNKVSLNDCLYNVNSTEILSNVTKNSDTQSIDLNIINETDDCFFIHYFTYKEEE